MSLMRDVRGMEAEPAVYLAKNMPICRYLAGATGLEPATSGVTGRYGPTGYGWLRPGIRGYSRHFLDERTGSDRLRPAVARQSLCGMRVVRVVPISTTMPAQDSRS